MESGLFPSEEPHGFRPGANSEKGPESAGVRRLSQGRNMPMPLLDPRRRLFKGGFYV
jgi:hypothetical protein